MIENVEASIQNNRFQVYYQPQFAFSSLRIVGAEARVRYIDESGTVHKASSFLSELEKMDQIAALDLWMLRQVCAQQQAWIANSLFHIPITVNLSAWTICNPYNIYDIVMLLKEVQLPRKAVKLALTSTTPYLSTLGIDKGLTHMKMQDIDIILNDFGSSFTTLSLFSDIDFDQIKIDKRFLRKAMDSARVQTIFKHIVTMSKSLNMEVVCGGVDTLLDAEFARSAGCDIGQGNYVSPLLSVQEFDKMRRQHIW